MSDPSRQKKKNDPLTSAIGAMSICAAVMAGVCFAIHGYSASVAPQPVAAEAQEVEGANAATDTPVQSAAAASSPSASAVAPSSSAASSSAPSYSAAAASKSAAAQSATTNAANPTAQVTTTTTPNQADQTTNTAQAAGGKSSKKKSSTNAGGGTTPAPTATTTAPAASSTTTSEPVREKVWVEPVYKTVHHPEEGHYDIKYHKVKKVQCNCGEIFDTREQWKAHQDAFIAEMRKTDPDYVCTGTHLSTYVNIEEPEQVYVVDSEAYDEQVLVREGYWK